MKNEIGDKHGIWMALNNIGTVYAYLGNYQKSLDYFQQALAIDKETGDKLNEGMYLTNIGKVYYELGYYSKALDYYQQALATDRELGDKYGEMVSLINIGLTYKKLDEYQKAKNTLQDSIAIGESIGVGGTWNALRALASTEIELKQPELAIKHYEQAIYNIDKARDLLTNEHKTSFMRRKIFIYDELIALLQYQHSKQPNKGYDRKSLEIFERKQGRLFLEEMGQSGVRRFSGLDDEIITEEQAIMLKWQKNTIFYTTRIYCS